LTESCPVTFNRLAEVRIGSIGPAAPGVSIRLVDLHGHDVAAGETGEILVRSPASCVGYWNDPAATTCLFDDGWLRTGDLASCDEDGYYWFKGRLKQLIIRGGSNISPQEVEEALHQHPAVLEAGVIGAPDSVNGEIVVAFVSGFPQNRPVPVFSAVGLARAGISASPLLVERVHHILDGEQ
jgi:long-chain acyl-CoA synthetase